MRWKTVQVKNGLHLMNKGNIQNICFKRRQRFHFPLQRYQKENVTKFQVGELSVPQQRPRNNKVVIVGNEHYDTIIVPEAQDSQYTNK